MMANFAAKLIHKDSQVQQTGYNIWPPCICMSMHV